MALGCVPGANLDGFWLQKSTKICSWTALGPSCGRLGPSWAVLEGSWDVLKRHRKMMQKKSAQKVGKKCVFRRLGGRFYEPRPPWFHNTRRTFFDALTDPRSGGGWAGILADFLGGRGRFWRIFLEGWNRFLSILVYIFCNIFASRFVYDGLKSPRPHNVFHIFWIITNSYFNAGCCWRFQALIVGYGSRITRLLVSPYYQERK